MYRDKVILLAATGAISLVLLIMGAYQLYEFTESNAFCGVLCHTVMEPEYMVYQESPHSNVPCVDCHVGPGASYLVKSKISGVGQIFAVIGGTFPRPITSPVINLRPASETCGQCHRPGIFSGDIVHTNTTFDVNEKNTQHSISMVLKVGAGGEKTARDIHWHVAANVWYLPLDEQRTKIGWVGIETESGIKEYYKPDSRFEVTEQRIAGEKRLMDCIDCHNRATHVFKSPEKLIDEAMAEGRIDPTLPYIKREAISALGQINPNLEIANLKIEAIKQFYVVTYPDVYGKQKLALDKAIEELKQVALLTTFTEMRVDYQTHLDNAGHTQSPGCFRCHGKLETMGSTGKAEELIKECNACHYNPGPEGPLKPAKLVPHVVVGLEDCMACHDASGTKPFPSDHVGRSNTLCISCHQPSGVTAPPSTGAIDAPKIPHSTTGLEGCRDCHDSSSIKPFPANHVGRTNDLCAYCHKPAQLAAPPPTIPPASKPIPHSIDGLGDCYSCHGTGSVRPYPANHVGRTNAQCIICHAPPQLAARPPATPPQAIPIPHSIAGLGDCFLCHGPGSVRPYPANHVGRSNELCVICHAPAPNTRPPSTPPPATRIPHSIIGLGDCLSCHSRTGTRPFPTDHIGRTNSQCTICHKP